jgi:hypothetical protein
VRNQLHGTSIDKNGTQVQLSSTVGTAQLFYQMYIQGKCVYVPCLPQTIRESDKNDASISILMYYKSLQISS